MIKRSSEVGSQPIDTKSSRAAQKLQEQSINLYQLYGKPLEQAHWGEYLAISPEGKTLLGSALLDVMERSISEFGPGNFFFKVGDVAVYKY